MVEIYFNVQSDNGSITDEHALRKWSTKYLSALEDRKDLRIGSRLRTLMTEAGFVEVDTKMIPLPLSAWSTGWSFVSPGSPSLLTQNRSQDERHWSIQPREYPATSSIHCTLSFDSAVAHATGGVHLAGDTSTTRGSRSNIESIFPTVSVQTQTHHYGLTE